MGENQTPPLFQNPLLYFDRLRAWGQATTGWGENPATAANAN